MNKQLNCSCSQRTLLEITAAYTYTVCIAWLLWGFLLFYEGFCCYMIAATIKHSAIIITEPYSVVVSELSTSCGQLSDCSRGLSTAIGRLSSTIKPS